MGPLPKHLRPRWRYFGVGIESWPNVTIDRRAFQGALWAAARWLLGDPGSADCDLTVVRFRYEAGGGEAIVRVRREKRTEGRAAIACLDRVDGEPIGLSIRGVSGTVRACNERYLGRRPEPADENTVAFSGTDLPAVRRNGRVDVRVNDGFVGATVLDIDADTLGR